MKFKLSLLLRKSKIRMTAFLMLIKIIMAVLSAVRQRRARKDGEKKM